MSGNVTIPTPDSTPIVYVEAPPLAAVKTGNAVLQKGHKGDAVSYIQELLGIGVDTRFGKDTEEAVAAFQQKQGIKTDPGYEGKVGRFTLAAIEKAAGTTPGATPVDTPGTTPGAVSPTGYDYDQRGKLKATHPALQVRVNRLAGFLAARGMDFLITDGLRTFQEQIELYKKGRRLVGGHWVPIDPHTKAGIVTYAWGGQSNHNYGLAIDAYPVIGGDVYTQIPKKASPEFSTRFKSIQRAIGEEGERAGLVWGGRWNHPYDPPHLQLFPQDEMRPQTCLKIYEQNGNSLAAVWQEVDRRLS